MVAEYGEYNERRAEVHLSGPITTDKKLTYRLDWGAHDSNETKRHFDFVSDRFLGGEVDYVLNNLTTIKLEVGYLKSAYDHARTTFDPNTMQPLASQTWTFDEPNDDLSSNWFRADFTMLNQLGTIFASRLFVGYNQFTNDWYEMDPLGFGPPNAAGLITTETRDALDYLVSNHTVTVQEDLNYNLDIGPVTNKIGVGGEEVGITGWQDEVLYNIAPINIYNPVYGALPTTFAGGIFPFSESRQTGAYVQDEMGLWGGRVLLNAGVRYNDVVTANESTGAVPTGTSTGYIHASQNTTRYGVLVHPIPHVSVYASHLEAFIFNTGTNYLGQPLIPSLGYDNEIGAKAELLDGGLILSISRFSLKLTNVYTLAYVINPITGLLGQGQVQTGFNTNNGFDANALMSKKLNDAIELDASATLYHGDILNNYGLKPEVPANDTWSALATVRTLKGSGFPGLAVGAGVWWEGVRVGPTFDVNGQTITYPPISEVDAFAEYSLGNWKLQLNLDNLGNKHYIEGDEGDTWIWLNPGLTWKASLTFRF